jgi:hypothetical protein
MAESLVPALTSIAEEEEAVSDPDAIRSRSSQKIQDHLQDGPYEFGKESLEIS